MMKYFNCQISYQTLQQWRTLSVNSMGKYFYDNYVVINYGHYKFSISVLDSSGKIPSGLLRGNINQLGDFDECLGVIAHVKMPDSTLKIQGKYCLVNIDIQSLETNMKIPLNLMQSRGFVKGTMNDPGHFIPKFTTVNWGLCIPAACTEVDAKNTMENSLSHLGNISGLKFTINVNESNCYVKHKVQNYSKETIGVLYFYAMIVCLVIVATFRDFIITNKDKQNYSERIIMSFSLKKTTKALFKPVDVDSDEITCIHGIRSIATIILYVGHKIISITGLPYTNREALTELANHPVTSVLRVAVVYTDSFLLISGVLISHSMAKEYAKNGEIRWFCRLIARYIRLTPALLIIIFWYAFIMEHFGSGPQWNSIMKTNADLCKNNAWTNLLYIQNFFPFEEMCATHTHHLAIDMQLSLLAPVLVFFLQNKPIIGIILIFFLLQVSATLRYFATINNYLSLVIFHGISIKHLYKTANLTYAVSIHRVTPYLFGIGLGVLLHHTGKKLNIYKIFIAIAWIITILLFTWALFWPWNASSRNYVYNAEDAAHYAVIGPVAWALALCWLIFACFTGYGGTINRCLSNYWLVVFSRISYSVYLTQFAVFFYNAASTRYSTEFQVYKIIDPYEALTVIVISIILTLFFDIPIQEVKNVLMESTKVIKTSTADETDSKHSKDHSKGSEIDNEQSWNPRYYEKFESNDDLDAELNTYEKVKKWEQMTEDYHNSMMNREKRRSKSTPRMLDTHLGSRIRETTPSLGDKRDQLYSRISEPRMFGSSDVSPRNLRKVPVNFISSESEDEPLHRKRSPRRPIERPRVSDEEDWEQELRIRRRRFVEKMTSEQDKSDTDEPDLIRRSSAEGKIALLKGPTGSRVMDAWTVSRGPRALLGSSQETDDDFYSRTDADYNKEIIQDKTSSISNVENRNQFNNNDSISNDNISTIPGKLFKRESIVKSQPSEEDPEYLLPERPKLVEQEQEHPFKKAWQMQKSKSEEDGPSAFAIKEVKVEEMQNQVDQKLPSPIESNIQLIIEDVDVTKKDDNQGRLKPVKQQTISLDDEDLMIDDNVQSPEAEVQNDDCVEKEKLEEDNTQDSV
ncbi:nose resistant to fluoxetine protein 6-like isoform X2 [Chelonus insularis]|uniref:nose resistant to fluoxetine protein 6-like isoform X2 n=1 Tax=Chelonus insularis TaxID=460826 RepID=UPI00158F4656|nr:nose resistant to fluoxetine protein 6-like isoform X2 [Chelonus insularis]